MQARILGSFQLEEGGRRIPLGGVRQRAVFVGLLLAVLGACHQVGDWQIISHRVTVPSCRCPEAARVPAALVLHNPTMDAGR